MGWFSKNKEAGSKELEEEQSRASGVGLPEHWYDSLIYKNLTPEKLVNLVEELRSGGEHLEYLSLLSELECVFDGHYRAQLQTRKLSVVGLPCHVVAASEDKRDALIAEAVREDIVEHDSFEDLLLDLLDALSKGYAVAEIVWKRDAGRWVPDYFVWRDQRWFGYDKKRPRELGFYGQGGAVEALPEHKYIVHEPHLISGPAILGGLGLPALFYSMLRRYCLVHWARFADRYGKPTLVGKYGRQATKDDIGTLKKAVGRLGSLDAAAVMPQSMVVELLESKSTGAISSLYDKLNDTLNKELSKIVLGQTMSSENGSSLSQAEIHNEVRKELRDGDAKQLAQSLNYYLVRSYVALNFGPEAALPRLVIAEPNSEDTKTLAEVLAQVVPMGLRVSQDEVRERLGLRRPDEGEELLGAGSAEHGPPQSPQNGGRQDNAIALNAEGASEYEAISDEMYEGLMRLAEKSSNYEEFLAELKKVEWPVDVLSDELALAMFKSFADGLAEELG